MATKTDVMRRPCSFLLVSILAGCATPLPRDRAAPLSLSGGAAAPAASGAQVPQAGIASGDDTGPDRKGSYRRNVETVFGDIDAAVPISPRLRSAVAPAVVEDDIERTCGWDPRNGVPASQVAQCLATERNRRVALLVHMSDERCSDYLNALNETGRDSNLVFGSLTTVLGSLGAILSAGATTSAALAGSAAGTNALRGEFGNAYFASRSVPTIQKSISSGRSRMRADLADRFSCSFQNYPYALAAAEVERYHAACSLSFAFTEIDGALENSNRALTPDEMKKQLANIMATMRVIEAAGGRGNPPATTAAERIAEAVRKEAATVELAACPGGGERILPVAAAAPGTTAAAAAGRRAPAQTRMLGAQ